MPEPFKNPKQVVPTIWVIDPQGKVRKEFEGGASDQMLYAALLDLRRGGNGDVEPEALPLSCYGVEDSGIEMGLCYLLLIAGVLYYPMALLMSTILTSCTVGFQYPAGFEAIAKTSRDYVFVVLFLGALLLAGEVLATGISIVARNHIPWVIAWPLAGFTRWWISCYGALVMCYALGRFYVRNGAALGWLAPSQEAPASPDSMNWKPPGAGAPPVPPMPEAPRYVPEPGPLGKAWDAFRKLPKAVDIGVAVVSLVLAVQGVRAEMAQWSFDADVGRCVGDLNRMHVDVKARLIEGFAKRGYLVSQDEIQLVGIDPDNSPPVAIVNVKSPGSGVYLRCSVFFGHASGGGGGFEWFQDAKDPRIWPAPKTRESFRMIFAVGGAFLALAFGLKAFYFERPT
ncbi:hypothetical protein HY251_16750 [bacterium]|nr:hypothetical protein [bacterium]